MPHAVSLALQEWVVSNLGYTRTLFLNNCINIIDVKELGNIKKLTLSGCIGITDVSMLGKVNKLNLSRCLNITANTKQKILEII